MVGHFADDRLVFSPVIEVSQRRIEPWHCDWIQGAQLLADSINRHLLDFVEDQQRRFREANQETCYQLYVLNGTKITLRMQLSINLTTCSGSSLNSFLSDTSNCCSGRGDKRIAEKARAIVTSV